MFIDDSLPYLKKKRDLPNGGPERESKRCAAADTGTKRELVYHVDLVRLSCSCDDPPTRLFRGISLDGLATLLYRGYKNYLRDCWQPGFSDPCSEKRPRGDPFKNVHLHYLHGLDKIISSILFSIYHSRPMVASYAPCDLGEQERSTQVRVVMAPVLKPIEYFSSLEEFRSVMRDYFQTVVTLEDYGLAHRNISLENLSIKTSSSRRWNGTGIISSFDSRSNGSEKGKCLPDFVYTMPARRINEHIDGQGDLRDDSLRSLFLCFIVLASTRCGPHNQKPSNNYFRYTALYQWNKEPDLDELAEFRRIARDKSSVLSSKTRFKKEVIDHITSYFSDLKPCFNALRSMIYDAHWAEYRNQLTWLYQDRAEYKYKRAKAVSIFKEVMDEAWTCTAEAQAMAETKPIRSDQTTSFIFCSKPGTRGVNDVEEFSGLSQATDQHASLFRFIDGRKTTSYAVNSEDMTVCEAAHDIRCSADCLQVTYCKHGGGVIKVDRREAALRAFVLICHLYAAGLSTYSRLGSSSVKGDKPQNEDSVKEVYSRMIRCPFSRSDSLGEEEMKISYDEHNTFLGSDWDGGA